MPGDAERRRQLYMQAKQAYDEAMAIDKEKLRIGSPEWERWMELNRQMLKAMEEYTRKLPRSPR